MNVMLPPKDILRESKLDLSELDEGNYFLYAISNLTGDLALWS